MRRKTVVIILGVMLLLAVFAPAVHAQVTPLQALAAGKSARDDFKTILNEIKPYSASMSQKMNAGAGQIFRVVIYFNQLSAQDKTNCAAKIVDFMDGANDAHAISEEGNDKLGEAVDHWYQGFLSLSFGNAAAAEQLFMGSGMVAAEARAIA